MHYTDDISGNLQYVSDSNNVDDLLNLKEESTGNLCFCTKWETMKDESLTCIVTHFPSHELQNAHLSSKLAVIYYYTPYIYPRGTSQQEMPFSWVFQKCWVFQKFHQIICIFETCHLIC